ncbi:DNA-binding protein [Pseudoprimorskyibacter insulae]|uniref:DNA-binding protein n=1 Tax=Pseudoprimorskyibacter insulae TaxID=1695997 RepID=A0A2R8APY9_9RHOB|nr:DNA-binding protein [Pseudoprimorskyibacter insulae]SPF78093.1 hypothetical protein PRI8871_00684 [Pseudoprimorskyibacter insulae]
MSADPADETLTSTGPDLPSGSVQEHFVDQAEKLIRRIAADLPEDLLALISSERPDMSDEALVQSVEKIGDLEPVGRVLLLRMVRALNHIVRDMPGDLLLSALAAPSDLEAFARALSDPRVSDPMRASDPLSGAVGRTIAHRLRLRELAGEMLTSSQVEDLLGIQRKAVDKRRKAHKLLGLRSGSDWLYPAFQFGHDDVLPGIRTVLDAFRDSDPWVVLDILLAPDEGLGGRTLLNAVRERDADAVSRHLAQATGDGFV